MSRGPAQSTPNIDSLAHTYSLTELQYLTDYYLNEGLETKKVEALLAYNTPAPERTWLNILLGTPTETFFQLSLRTISEFLKDKGDSILTTLIDYGVITITEQSPSIVRMSNPEHCFSDYIYEIAFYIAAYEENISTMKQILKHMSADNTVDNNATTFLYCFLGNAPAYTKNVDFKFDVNNTISPDIIPLLNHFFPDEQIEEAPTALHIALKKQHQEMLDLLMELTPRCDIPNKNGQTALHFSLTYNNTVATLESLLIYGEYSEEQYEIQYIQEIVLTLLTQMTHITMQNREGIETPLESCILLLFSKAKTPFYFSEAHASSFQDLIPKLLENKQFPLIQLLAAYCDHKMLASELETYLQAQGFNLKLALLVLELSDVIDCNIQDLNGDTALHYTMKTRPLIYSKDLLYHGASFDIKNNENKTPLRIAFEKKQHYALADIFMNKEKTTSTKRSYLASILFFEMILFFYEDDDAASNTQPSDIIPFIHTLNEEKPNLSYTPQEMGTLTAPFFRILEHGHYDVIFAIAESYNANKFIGLIRSYFADRHFGDTLNSFLVITKHIPLLISINLQDSNGHTALHRALHNQDQATIEQILQQTPRYDIPDSQGKTALHLAFLQHDPLTILEALLIQGQRSEEERHTAELRAEIFVELLRQNMSECPEEKQTQRQSQQSTIVPLLYNHNPGQYLDFNKLQIAFIQDQIPTLIENKQFSFISLLANYCDPKILTPALETYFQTHYFNPGLMQLVSNLSDLIDVNIQDRNGNTALHYALQTTYNSRVSELLNYGAAFDIENNDKKTPLHLTLENQHYHDLLNLLLSEGKSITEDWSDLASTLSFELLVRPLNSDSTQLDTQYSKITPLLYILNRGEPHFTYTDQQKPQLTKALHQVLEHAHYDLIIAILSGRHANTLMDDIESYFTERLFEDTFKLFLGVRSLTSSIDINLQDSDGNTTLHHTTKHNNTTRTTDLLKSGAIYDRTNNEGKTPLHYALDHGNLHSLKELIEQGQQSESDHSVLFSEILIGVITTPIPNPDDPKSHPEATLKTNLVKTLLRLGAHFDISNCKEDERPHDTLQTAVHYLIRTKHYTLLKTLINNGNAAHIASCCAAYIQENDFSNDPTVFATLADLNNQNIDINLCDALGRNLLHYTVIFHNIPDYDPVFSVNFLKLLFKQNIILDARDINNETPLHIALNAEHHALLLHFAEYAKKSTKNYASLMSEIFLKLSMNARYKEIDLWNTFFDAGARLDKAHGALCEQAIVNLIEHNDHDYIPVFSRYNLSLSHFITLLQAHSFNINQKDPSGKTLLHYALQYRSLEDAYLLIKHGALLDIWDHQQNTPLHFAAQIDNSLDTLDALLTHPLTQNTLLPAIATHILLDIMNATPPTEDIDDPIWASYRQHIIDTQPHSAYKTLEVTIDDAHCYWETKRCRILERLMQCGANPPRHKDQKALIDQGKLTLFSIVLSSKFYPIGNDKLLALFTHCQSLDPNHEKRDLFILAILQHLTEPLSTEHTTTLLNEASEQNDATLIRALMNAESTVICTSGYIRRLMICTIEKTPDLNSYSHTDIKIWKKNQISIFTSLTARLTEPHTPDFLLALLQTACLKLCPDLLNIICDNTDTAIIEAAFTDSEHPTEILCTLFENHLALPELGADEPELGTDEEAFHYIYRHTIKDNQLDIIQFLLNHGANPAAITENGTQLLDIAIQHSRPKIINLLLKALINNGLSLHIVLEDGSSLLMKAVEWRYSDIVQILVDKGADIHYKHPEYRETAYTKAVAINHTGCIKILAAAHACFSHLKYFFEQGYEQRQQYFLKMQYSFKNWDFNFFGKTAPIRNLAVEGDFSSLLYDAYNANPNFFNAFLQQLLEAPDTLEGFPHQEDILDVITHYKATIKEYANINLVLAILNCFDEREDFEQMAYWLTFSRQCTGFTIAIHEHTLSTYGLKLPHIIEEEQLCCTF